MLSAKTSLVFAAGLLYLVSELVDEGSTIATVADSDAAQIEDSVNRLTEASDEAGPPPASMSSRQPTDFSPVSEPPTFDAYESDTAGDDDAVSVSEPDMDRSDRTSSSDLEPDEVEGKPFDPRL